MIDTKYFENQLWCAHELCDELLSDGDFNEELISRIFKIVKKLWIKTVEKMNLEVKII